jgi:hypothetical protein
VAAGSGRGTAGGPYQATEPHPGLPSRHTDQYRAQGTVLCRNWYRTQSGPKYSTCYHIAVQNIIGSSVPDQDPLGSVIFRLPRSGSWFVKICHVSEYCLSSEYSFNKLKILSLTYVYFFLLAMSSIYLPLWELFIINVVFIKMFLLTTARRCIWSRSRSVKSGLVSEDPYPWDFYGSERGFVQGAFCHIAVTEQHRAQGTYSQIDSREQNRAQDTS